MKFLYIVSDLSSAENHGYLGDSPEIDNSDPLWETILQGDINVDGEVNVVDVIMVVNMILEDLTNQDSADINSDGLINVVDVILLVNIILNN